MEKREAQVREIGMRITRAALYVELGSWCKALRLRRLHELLTDVIDYHRAGAARVASAMAPEVVSVTYWKGGLKIGGVSLVTADDKGPATAAADVAAPSADPGERYHLPGNITAVVRGR